MLLGQIGASNMAFIARYIKLENTADTSELLGPFAYGGHA